MLLEAIEQISLLTTKADEAQVFGVTGLPHKTFIRADGKIEAYEHQLPSRSHVCLDLESLGRWVTASAGADDQVVTWYGFTAVEAVLNDQGHRDDRVKMPLTLHPKYKAATAGVRGVSQAGLINWIRQNLRQEFTAAAPGFESLVRRLKFAKGGDSERTVQHGQESFSQEVLAEVSGAADIPEELTLLVPVWEEMVIAVELTLGVYIDAHEAEFALLPLTGEVVRARNHALGQLETMVEEFCGAGEIYRGTEN